MCDAPSQRFLLSCWGWWIGVASDGELEETRRTTTNVAETRQGASVQLTQQAKIRVSVRSNSPRSLTLQSFANHLIGFDPWFILFQVGTEHSLSSPRKSKTVTFCISTFDPSIRLLLSGSGWVFKQLLCQKKWILSKSLSNNEKFAHLVVSTTNLDVSEPTAMINQASCERLVTNLPVVSWNEADFRMAGLTYENIRKSQQRF